MGRVSRISGDGVRFRTSERGERRKISEINMISERGGRSRINERC